MLYSSWLRRARSRLSSIQRSWQHVDANKVRKDNIKKHHPKYVKWGKIVKSSRAPQVHCTTAQRSFKREGILVLFAGLLMQTGGSKGERDLQLDAEVLL